MAGKVRKNRFGAKICDPRVEIHPSQLRRVHPSWEDIRASKRPSIDRFGEAYRIFVNNSRTSTDVVDNIRKLSSSKRFSETPHYFVESKEGAAFALIRPPTNNSSGVESILENGVKVVYTHGDACCLRAKVRPLLFEWDIDLRELHTGVELDTFEYGGLLKHEWAGRGDLEARGRIWLMDKLCRERVRKFSFPVYSAETAQHTDVRLEKGVDFEDAHRVENLNLDTGFRTVREFLQEFGLREEADFARTELYIVPTIVPKLIGPKNGPKFMSAYGHDDRTCLYSAVRALLDADKLESHCMVFGFDKEEVGSMGPGGAGSKFFENVLIDYLVQTGAVSSRREVSEGLLLDIYGKSLAIDGDVDVASTSRELEDGDAVRNIDKKNIAKLGYGPFINGTTDICDGDCVSPRLVGRVMSCLAEANLVMQPIGFPTLADKSDDVRTMNNFMQNRGIPTINVGVPVASLHSISELISVSDLYGAYRAYRAILEDGKYFRSL